MKPETDKAIDAGLAYLKNRQNDDGSFGSGQYGRNSAVCSLAGLAMLAHGSTPGRGPYGRRVNRCVTFLLQHTLRQRLHYRPRRQQPRADVRARLRHAVPGRSCTACRPDPAVREKLARAVKLIVSTQNDEGGWRYEPKRQDADISVTVCQIMALRAARNAGIFVPNATIDRCIDYVKRSQNADGGFMYMLSGPRRKPVSPQRRRRGRAAQRRDLPRAGRSTAAWSTC